MFSLSGFINLSCFFSAWYKSSKIEVGVGINFESKALNFESFVGIGQDKGENNDFLVDGHRP